MQVDIFHVLWPYIYKSLMGAAVAGIGALMVWPFRKAKKEWTTLRESTAAIHSELIQQRQNCLTTLQSQGEAQVTLLTKVADTLGGVRLDLAEQTGYLAAQSVRPARSRAKK